jgi:hypothetical protein
MFFNKKNKKIQNFSENPFEKIVIFPHIFYQF